VEEEWIWRIKEKLLKEYGNRMSWFGRRKLMLVGGG
jgi:hypothetical protein